MFRNNLYIDLNRTTTFCIKDGQFGHRCSFVILLNTLDFILCPFHILIWVLGFLCLNYVVDDSGAQ